MTRYLTTCLAFLATAPMLCAGSCYVPSYSPRITSRTVDYPSDYYPPAFFTKFVAFLPVAEFPTYSAVAIPAVLKAAPPVAAPAPAPATTPAPAPAAAAASDLGRAVAALEKVSGQLGAVTGRLSAVESRLDRLERIVASLPPVGPLPPLPPVPAAPAPLPKVPAIAPDGMAVLKNSCFACHMKGSESKGGKVVLLTPYGSDFARAPITDATAKALEQAVREGAMPPEKAVRDGTVAALTPEQKDALLKLLADWPRKEK